MMAAATLAARPNRIESNPIRATAAGRWPEILSRLNIHVPGNPKQHGPCPACGGKDRFRFDDQDGKGTWFCNQCDPKAGDGFALVQNVRRCSFPEALGLVADALGQSPDTGSRSRTIEAMYDYCDASGALRFQVVRFTPKDFRQRRPDGHGGWIWNLQGIEPVLYRMPEVLSASTILIVEGEKDVETASQLGLPEGWAATCNPMGAGKWRSSYTEAVRGRHIVICPDADAPGVAHAEQIASAVRLEALSVLRLRMPDGVKDLSVWATGRTSEDFRALIDAAEPWSYSPPKGRVSGMSGCDSSEWPDFFPVRTELRPVDPLSLALVPAAFRAWVEDVSNRMQCPPDYVATAMLAMAGSVIGAGCGIRPKQHDDWTVVPNLWGGVVGRPSMLKTPAIGEALKPLDGIEALAKQEYDAAQVGHEASMEAYKAKREAIKSDMRQVSSGKSVSGKRSLSTIECLTQDFADLKEPEAPIWRRYRTNDATIEKMAELQAHNPRGLLLFRDELIGLFATWDKDGHEADRAFYLESWNGIRPYTSDRIGRGSVFVDNLCVSLFGGIQPTKLTSYLHAAMRGHNNDGLVQRLQLLVYPDEPKTWRLTDTPVNYQAREQAYQAVRRLAGMDFRQYGAFAEEGQRIPYYRFDADGQKVFYEWLEELEAKIRQPQDEPVLLEHLGKYRSLMPALALLVHVIGLADGHPIGGISKESATQAAAWCEYLEGHARRIYGLVTNVTKQAAARLAGKLQDGALPVTFTVRDVYRKEWSLLDDRQMIENACDELVSLGWLREQVTMPAPGQRGKTEYVTNPKVHPNG